MANKKIKKINLGGTEYDIHDAATADVAAKAKASADVKVATINGYTYDQINAGQVLFAETAISTSEIDSAVDNIGTSSN